MGESEEKAWKAGRRGWRPGGCGGGGGGAGVKGSEGSLGCRFIPYTGSWPVPSQSTGVSRETHVLATTPSESWGQEGWRAAASGGSGRQESMAQVGLEQPRLVAQDRRLCFRTPEDRRPGRAEAPQSGYWVRTKEPSQSPECCWPPGPGPGTANECGKEVPVLVTCPC